ncbi:MAG: cell division protein FtsQ/DivIB [bacterium]
MSTWKKRLFIATLTALTCSLAVWGGYRLLDRIQTFRVSRITLAGAERCDTRKIGELAFSAAYGRCIFKVNLPDLYQQIRSDGWIRNLSIRRVMPSTLEIQIEERVPFGILHADQLFLVDREGVLITAIGNKKAWKSLPLIRGLDLKGAGAGCKPDSPGLESALNALALMQEMRAPWLAKFREISVKSPENLILSSQGKGCEIRLGSSNLRENLQYLKSAWSTIQASVSGIQYIDLRYKNQLIIKPHKHIG